MRALGFTQAGFWREHGRFASMEELIGDPMSSLLDETETITVELATTSEWWAWRRSESGWGFAIGCSGDDPLAFRYYDGKAVPKDGPLGTGWLTSDASHWSGDWA